MLYGLLWKYELISQMSVGFGHRLKQDNLVICEKNNNVNGKKRKNNMKKRK